LFSGDGNGTLFSNLEFCPEPVPETLLLLLLPATFETSPKYRMVHIYNKFPSKIKCIKRFSCFKKAVFNLLFKLNLYNVPDFWLRAFACYYCVNMVIFSGNLKIYWRIVLSNQQSIKISSNSTIIWFFFFLFIVSGTRYHW
jgi:hypothetical protein